jgi:hypothetical protein
MTKGKGLYLFWNLHLDLDRLATRADRDEVIEFNLSIGIVDPPARVWCRLDEGNHPHHQTLSSLPSLGSCVRCTLRGPKHGAPQPHGGGSPDMRDLEV